MTGLWFVVSMILGTATGILGWMFLLAGEIGLSALFLIIAAVTIFNIILDIRAIMRTGRD